MGIVQTQGATVIYLLFNARLLASPVFLSPSFNVFLWQKELFFMKALCICMYVQHKEIHTTVYTTIVIINSSQHNKHQCFRPPPSLTLYLLKAVTA